MKLLLQNQVPNHQGLPREYDLVDTDSAVQNTFVFNESDLEGFKHKNKLRKQAADQGIPSYLMRPKVDKSNQPDNRGGRRGRGRDTFRQMIPSTSYLFLSCAAFV